MSVSKMKELSHAGVGDVAKDSQSLSREEGREETQRHALVRTWAPCAALNLKPSPKPLPEGSGTRKVAQIS